LIGGSEIGIGALMIFGGKLSISIRARLWFAMFLFGGIVLARLVSIAISGATIPEMIMRELIAELFCWPQERKPEINGFIKQVF